MWNKYSESWLLWSCVLSSLIADVWCSEAEYHLVKDLLRHYDVNVRPARNSSEPVEVKVGVALNQIIDLDERNQIINLNIWLRLNWYDSHLTWTPGNYSGIEAVRILGRNIWRPDITLYNDVRETMRDMENELSASVYSDGLVVWNTPNIVRSSCILDVQYFPWDQQICHLKYGSWTYDGTKVDLANRSLGGDISVFIKNGEWDLIAMPVTRDLVYYKCCPEAYPSIKYWIIIRRKALYYVFNLILPCVFITATTILVFYLPPDSGEKVSLGVTVLLALTVFLLLVAETMPPQSVVIPLIGQYFGATIMMLALSTALTVVVLNIHHRGAFGNEVPYFIRKVILDWLARVMCLKERVDDNLTKMKKSKVSAGRYENANGFINQDLAGGGTAPYQGPVAKNENHAPSPVETLLSQILNTVKGFEQHLDTTQKDDGCRKDWMLVAMVVDRFLLIVFTILTVTVSVGLLFNRPQYHGWVLPDPDSDAA